MADTPAQPGVHVRLRARHLALHRLPPLRLRLRRGEQPVARSADPLDPRARDGEGEGRRLRARRRLLRARAGAARRATSTCRSRASSAATRRARRSARRARPGQEPDGIVVIDYDWCIGCRCCMAACPYGARHFNWGEPTIPKDELNPNTHYLGNRPRPKGVVEKCTFCIQRVRDGPLPGLRRGLPGRRAQVRQPARSRERDPLHHRAQAGARAEGGAEHRAEVLLLLRNVRSAVSSLRASRASPPAALRLVIRGNAALLGVDRAPAGC